MTEKLFLRDKDRLEILRLLAQHLPSVTAWAYGSRVNGGAHEGSDLDIVLRSPDLSPILLEELQNFVRALQDSNIPILVEARDWARLPESFQREIMKNYVVLREIVSEWREVELGSICDIYDGPHATPPKQDNGFIFLGISSLGFDGRIDSTQFEYVSEEFFKKWTKRIEPQYRDIVFSYETKLGVAAILPKNFRCCLGRRMGLLRVKDNVDPQFVLYAYLAPEFQKTIYERTFHGSTVDRIPLKDLGSFPILITSLPEQKAIASVLSSLDDKIDLLHRQNKTLEAMAETLFRQWFVEEGGEDGCLGDFAVNVTKSAKVADIKSDDVYVGLEHIERRNISLVKNGSGGDVESNKYCFKEMDILFGKLRPYFHKVCFAPFDGICSTDILVIRPKKKHLFGYCLFAFFQNDVVEYANLGSGGTRMPRTNWETLSQYPVAVPDENKLIKFNEIAQSFIEKIAQNQKQIRTIEQLRDTLLPKLMSGEVRVAC